MNEADFMERVKRVILARHAYLVNAQEVAGVDTSPMSYEDWRVYEYLCTEFGVNADSSLFRAATSQPNRTQSESRAMRLAAVWDKHADKLRRFTAIAKADQPHYATVNRHTLSKALREFIADMAGAEEEP